MSTVTEFMTGAEVCTATVCLEQETGESHIGPLHIGYYPRTDEVWVEQEGRRVQFPGRHLNDVIKQLKRAQKIAKETT